jgi:predicted amidohydrolase
VCFPELFAEYERLQVHWVLSSSWSADPAHCLMARAHAATNCYWVSLATPEACSGRLSSMLVGPDGGSLAVCASERADVAVGTIDLGAPRFEIPLRRARQWRARARSGELYAARRP